MVVYGGRVSGVVCDEWDGRLPSGAAFWQAEQDFQNHVAQHFLPWNATPCTRSRARTASGIPATKNNRCEGRLIALCLMKTCAYRQSVMLSRSLPESVEMVASAESNYACWPFAFLAPNWSTFATISVQLAPRIWIAIQSSLFFPGFWVGDELRKRMHHQSPDLSVLLNVRKSSG